MVHSTSSASVSSLGHPKHAAPAHIPGQTRSFVSDFDDGVITPVDSPTQGPEVKLDHSSFDAPLSSGTIEDQSWHGEKDMVSLFGDSDVLPVSLRQRERLLRPPPLELRHSMTPPTSMWFDDTPTQRMFPEEPPNEVDAEWEVQSEWLDDLESPVYSSFSQPESDDKSTFTFGRDNAASPDQSSQSHDSATMVSTEDDDRSVESSESQPFDSMDEQLSTSPIDSFAAVCWTSATSERKARLSMSVPELRLSRLFNDEARDYEECHLHEYSEKIAEKLPCMQFSGEFVPRGVPAEDVAPWMYLPKKAVSVLDMPKDPRTSELTKPSQNFHRVHRRGQQSLSAITGKCRKAMGCLNGVGGS